MLCSQSITVLKSQGRYVYMYRHIQEYEGGARSAPHWEWLGLKWRRSSRTETCSSVLGVDLARVPMPDLSRAPACRTRPFTTQADRLRLPRQRRSAAAQLSKAYLPVNISVQERAAANVSWYSKSGSSA